MHKGIEPFLYAYVKSKSRSAFLQSLEFFYNRVIHEFPFLLLQQRQFYSHKLHIPVRPVLLP